MVCCWENILILCFYQIWMSHHSATCKALFDCDYKLDCWPDCSQIVARLFCGTQPPMCDSVWQHIKSGWHLIVGMNVPITGGSHSLPQGDFNHHKQ
jgi:hypothetical protein